MDCKRARRLLTAHLDGEVPEGTARELATHLGECVPCGSELDTERRLRALVRAVAPPLGRQASSVSPARAIFDARRACAEEAVLVRVLKRVSAVAALLVLASGLALGMGHAGSRGVAAAESSIRAVAVSSSEARLDAMIDRENSILLAIAGR